MQMQMRPKYNKSHLKRKREREEENSKFQIPNWSEWKEMTMAWLQKKIKERQKNGKREKKREKEKS